MFRLVSGFVRLYPTRLEPFNIRVFLLFVFWRVAFAMALSLMLTYPSSFVWYCGGSQPWFIRHKALSTARNQVL